MSQANLQETPKSTRSKDIPNISFLTSSENNDSSSEIDISTISELYVSKSLHDKLLKLKCEYIRQVQVLDEKTTSDDVFNSTSVNFILNTAVSKTVHKTLKKAEIGDLYLDLLDKVRPLCLSSYSENDSKAHLSKINSNLPPPSIDEFNHKIDILSNELHRFDLTDVKKQLGDLQASVDSLKSQGPDRPPPPGPPKSPPIKVSNMSADFNDPGVKDQILNITHVDEYSPEFLDSTSLAKLAEFCDACDFVDEGGHKIIKFGESYDYNGARTTSADMPAAIRDVMDRLNEDYVGNDRPHLNSCLINKFNGADSYIAAHSDNERSIERDSSIYTVSIGQSRTVDFVHVLSGADPSLRVNSGSMYSMSRISQEFYRHRVDPEEGADEVRYSLTFRSLSWRNHNRTLLMGDSNTKYVKFGDEKGTLGKAIPGRRFEAFTIDQLDPVECIGYNNIILHCGINDIKSQNISDKDLNDVYVNFKHKVEDIRRLNRTARIIVSPVLPTRLIGLNKKALSYNRLLFNDLNQSGLNIAFVHGYDDMVDRDRCLDMRFSRDYDFLHLSPAGVSYLASCMKAGVLYKKRSNGKQHSGRSYASMVGRGDWHPS